MLMLTIIISLLTIINNNKNNDWIIKITIIKIKK